MTQTSELHDSRVPSSVGDGSSRRSRGRSAALESLLEDRHRCFLVLLLAGVAVALLAEVPNFVHQDTWLALVDGRQIVQHGIPHHVILTQFGYGHAWIDQQWLAQVCMYGLDRLGGLGLVGVVNVALIAAGLGGAAVAAVRLGAGARSVLLVLPLVAVTVALTYELRTQPYAYPLFVLTVYLLASDSRRPGRAVLWCLPVLVLWGNLHGSASLGAGLVVLRGLTSLWEGRRGLRRAPTAVALIAGAPLALLVTPYGFAIVSYYRATLLSPAFRSLVTEWQPVTVDLPHAVLFFLLAGAVVWALGRYTAASTPWERLATLVLAAGAIIAVRNVVWFALATLILLPVWIDAAVRSRDRPAAARPRLNGVLLTVAAVAVVASAGAALATGNAPLSASYPPAALAAVRDGLDGHAGARVFADETYADWLLWEMPGLRGRVAYDAAFELLSREQLEAIVDLKSVTGLSWPRAVEGDRVLVLADTGDPNPVHALRVREGARLLYDHDGVAVLER